MNISSHITAFCLAVVFAAPAVADGSAMVDLSEVLAGDHRSAEHKARDQYRHPKETLEFFGLEPDMTVVEISPGGGWYTEILAPYLAAEGKLIAAHGALNGSAYMRRSLGNFLVKLGEKDELYKDVEVVSVNAPEDIAAAVPGGADMVVTFRNAHGWVRDGKGEAMFQAMADTLKPGGILGVVQHRWHADKPRDKSKHSGYVAETEIRKFAAAAGLEFVASSEINANPEDTKDHPGGVWTLPPSLDNVADADRPKYLAIGESDRMTLKFRKPEERASAD